MTVSNVPNMFLKRFIVSHFVPGTASRSNKSCFSSKAGKHVWSEASDPPLCQCDPPFPCRFMPLPSSSRRKVPVIFLYFREGRGK